MKNTIFNENCLETLKRIDNDYLDLTITSPPYNVDLGNNKYNKNSYDIYIDNRDHKDYINWLSEIFYNIYLKTKVSGRICINIGDGKNGSICTHSDIIQTMVKMKWIPITTIIWDKNNVSNRTAFGSFNSPSCPSFPTPFEYILVFCKESRKLKYKGETDLIKEDFIKWSLAKWSFTGESSKRINHPAPFPIELPTRCIKMFSWINSIIYDPFMGSGTTAIAALNNNRYYIGSEISEQYYNNSLQRIKQLNDLFNNSL